MRKRYIYEAMDRVKETIHNSFNNNEEKNRQKYDTIDEK